jgi:hypothetical protein
VKREHCEREREKQPFHGTAAEGRVLAKRVTHVDPGVDHSAAARAGPACAAMR